MLKKISILFSGTLLAQLIPFLSLPFITRVFTPEEFGEYSLYLTFITIGVILATLRLELAIPIIKNEDLSKDLDNIVVSSVILSFLLSFFFLLLIELMGSFTQYNSFFLFVTYFISILSISMYQIYYQFGIKVGKFKELSISKWSNQLILAIILLLTGYIYGQYMIVALLISQIIWAVSLKFRLSIKISYRDVNKSSISKTLYKYRKFPKLQLPIQLLNTFSLNSMVIGISYFYSSNELGFYSLTERLLRSPINILGSVTSDVFKNMAVKEMGEKNTCINSYKKAMVFNFFTGLVIFTVLYFSIECVITYFFGSEWSQSATYAQYLIPSLFFTYIFFPVNYLYVIYNLQQIDIKIQFSQFLVISFWIVYGGASGYSVSKMLIGYSVILASFSVLSGLIGFWIIKFRKG